MAEHDVLLDLSLFWEIMAEDHRNNKPQYQVRKGESSTDNSKQVSKRLKSSVPSKGIDRISTLPEALIVHILSLLSTRDKIRTGALSQRWQFLWTRVPEFHFNWKDPDRHGHNILGCDECIKYTNRTLNLLGHSKVKSFGVKLWGYEAKYDSDVDAWTRFTACHGIEKFELDFSAQEVDNYYKLPQLLYRNSTLKELLLADCNFDFAVRGTVSWTSLKKLSTKGGYLSNQALQKILTGTPLLEILNLTIVRCTDSTLHLKHSHLKTLILDVTDLDENGPVVPELEILAPKLESLKVSGYFQMSKLVNVKSLVEATLFGPSDDEVEYLTFTREVVYSLLNVRTLTFDTWVIQGIATLMADNVRPSFSECKCLTVDTYLETDPSAIARLLQSTPEIETLIVTTAQSRFKVLSSQHNISDIDQFWKSQEVASSYLTHLRTVKFDRFRDHGIVAFSFVQFLLKNAGVLQNMLINLVEDGYPNVGPAEAYKISQKLLRFHRSSPDAEVLVYP